MIYNANAGDLFKNTRQRDGALPRDGGTWRIPYSIEAYVIKYAVAAVYGGVSIGEGLTACMRKRLFRNGEYVRDGSILRDSILSLPA
ncbi:MAG: hypothetical protein LBP19_02965 [Treponema sp.]|nr:hypothetical protein [Treponema sp.]